MPSKTESPIIEVSRKVYETSLSFYPDDLRTDFGEEMIEVFEQQISEAYKENGTRGLLQVWLCAAREFVSIALTSQLTQRMVPVVAAITALALMLWLGGFMVAPISAAGGGCGR